MIDEKYIELINKLIDRTISKREQAVLDAYLSQHPDARNLCDRMLAAAEAMRRVTEVEPPERLAQSVLRDLEGRPLSRGSWWRPVPERIRNWLEFRPLAGLAAGAAMGGLVVALIFGSLGDYRSMSEDALVGTLVWGDGPSCVASSDEKDIVCPGVGGTIAARPTDSYVLVDLSIESEREIAIELEFPEADTWFRGVTQRGGGLTDVATQEDGVTLHHVGSNQYTFVFDNESGGITAIGYSITADSLLSTNWLQTLACH